MIQKHRIDDLCKSKEEFEKYVDAYYDRHLDFPRSSQFFHSKVIEMIRTEKLAKLLVNELFFERVYATLSTWGMDRMGGGARLVDFSKFKDNIERNTDLILALDGFNLWKLDKTTKSEISDKLSKLFSSIRVMETSINLVGTSKTLHHMLPDLIPPIDREYTLKFVYNVKDVSTANETKKFLEIFDIFHTICTRLNLTNEDLKIERKWDTSVPKLIDNAIIGFIDLRVKGQ